MPRLPRLRTFDRSRAVALAALVRARPYHLGLGALCVGLALAASARSGVVLVAGVAALSLAALRAPALGVLAAAAVVAGAALGAARLEQTDHSTLAARAPGSLEARAVLVERPRPSRFGSRVTLELTGAGAAGERLMAYADRDLRWPREAGPGTEALVAGSLRRPRSKPGADFDWPAYLRRHGILVELRLDRLRPMGRRRGGILGAIDGARRRAEWAVAAGLPAQHAALARGMVLGEDESVSEPVREDFRRSGLSHILAVSGQNVMLLCALATPFLTALAAGPRVRAGVMLALIALYVPLAGAGPSLQRAGVMGAAGVLALGAGRPASRWYALLLAAAVTLIVNPRVLGDPGWQLSFAAVVAILALGRRIRAALDGLPGPLAEGVAITVAATVGTAPLLAHHFGSVSLSSLPANVVAMPAVAATMWLGMLGAAVGQIAAAPALISIALAAATGLGKLNDLCLSFIEAVAERFAAAPGASVELPLGNPAAVLGAYAGIAVLAFAAIRLAPRIEPSLASARAAFRRLSAARRRPLAAVAATLPVLALVAALTPPAPPSEVTVSFLDVGQGDSTLVQSPEGGAVLFDGGPPEAGVTRLLRRAGVSRLSAVVATHQSRDHQGGLADVLAEIPTDLYVDGGDGNTDPAFLALARTAARRGVRRVVPRQGDVLRAPGIVVRVLGPPSRPSGPPPRPSGPPPDDPNPRALATVVSAHGLDLFLSGDAESPSLLPLPLPEVDAMKVSHHGSRDPGLPMLLKRLRPQVAGIEVGRGNTYGHPTPQTLAALRTAHVPTYRTDRDGTVTARVVGGRIRVSTER